MRDGTETKQKIERMALNLFVQKGVKETTIKEISMATGLSEGAMYRHYSSKDELAEVLFLKNYVAFSQELEMICKSNDTLSLQLEKMVERFCQAFDDDPVLYSYLLLSQHDELKRIDPDEMNPVKVLDRMLNQAIDEGKIAKIDSQFVTAQIMGIVLETAKFIIYQRLDGTMMDYREQLISSCLKIVGYDE